MDEGSRSRRGGALVSARCSECGTTVYSPQLSPDELLRRHRPYCPAAADPDDGASGD
ncbi:MAG TPA: hypothetical protein VFA11_16985 [Acidimicrobiales bacterium]|nr:hypothetical protein [Acidimicrobiales bacterium]